MTMRKCFRVFAAVLLAVASVAGLARPAAAETKLTMVGAWTPAVSAAADIGMRFMEEVNRTSGGKLTIEFKGAAEVVPTFDQPEALVKGVFDVWYGAPNYWAGVIPTGYLTELSQQPVPDAGPGSDLFKFMEKIYAPKGVQYLGHYAGPLGKGDHFLYTQKEVKSIADLKGMKIRVPPLTRFFVKAVGAEPVTLPPGDIYLALDRGTVEGFTWPYYDGFTNFAWHEVSKYLVKHPLYRNGIGIAMNMAKWKSLTKEQQDIVFDAARSTQIWAQGWIAAHDTAQLTTMTKAGMKVITFSPAEGKRWTETATESLWANFKAAMSPEDYATARKLLGYK